MYVLNRIVAMLNVQNEEEHNLFSVTLLHEREPHVQLSNLKTLNLCTECSSRLCLVEN